jgi:flagellar motor switch protein FliN
VSVDTSDDHPLATLPRVSARQVDLNRMVARSQGFSTLATNLFPSLPIEIGPLDVIWRASGLSRPGVVAQLAWPRQWTRVGFGLETALVHAVVDRMLGYSRLPAENHRQVTPVEWGILSFVFARALDHLDSQPGPFGPWDLTIDRVGPDPFDPRDLGPIITLRWPLTIGSTSGSARLWAPESLLHRVDLPTPTLAESPASYKALASTWSALAGTISLARGLGRLKVGGVLPIDGAALKGTVASPLGTILLSCTDGKERSWFEASAVPNSSAARLTLTSPLSVEPSPREPIAVNPASPTTASPTDVPVTLVVELGRVNLPLSRLADLKPGDVIELGRHSREPVELTSNGRLVARGELVQIDTELGVRVTHVLL